MEIKEKVEQTKETVKQKAEEVKEKAKEVAAEVGKATNEAFNKSPDLFFKIAMIGGGILVGALSGAVDTSANRNKKCLVKDDVTGLEYLTKHPLTNKEIVELSDRMVDGETHGEALNNMGLLRNERKRR